MKNMQSFLRRSLSKCLFLVVSQFSCVALAADLFQMAVGGSLGLQMRKDYGEGVFKRTYPEIVTFGYLPTPLPHTWLRPGLRFAYVAEQPEMPKGLRLEERDFVSSAELGFLYDWYVIPSLAMGGGFARRSLQLKTSPPIEQKEGISSTENLPFMYGQLGLGVPFGKGFVVVEPFYRYSSYSRDSRISWQYGVELSFKIF
jgi:hypothetical protein